MLRKITPSKIFRNIATRLSYNMTRTISGLKYPADIVINDTKDLPSLMDCRQGERANGLFTEAEMGKRLTKLRQTMSSVGIDVAVFTSYHNIVYYSEFLYCYFGRPYGFVVTQDDATTISSGVDYGQPWRRARNCANITYTDWQRDNFFKAVAELVGSNKTVGVEYDWASFQTMEKFKNALPGATLSDISSPTMKLRMVKSDEEIAVIKEGARIANFGGYAAKEALSDGVREHEVALHSTQAMVREIAKSHPQVDIMDTWTWVQSGINSDGAHNPVTSRKIRSGDIISFNCFPMIQGYYAALERTMFINHASESHIKIWEANIEVQKRGLQLIKPGAKLSEIALELNDIFKKHGLLQYRTIGYGHSIGGLCHYYGREAGLEIRDDIDTVLEPNMVVSMEPMVTIPEGNPGAGGYREHDICVVREDGMENVTDFPTGPEHNIIKK